MLFCLGLIIAPKIRNIWSDLFLLCYVAIKNNSLQGYYDESNNPATPELVSSMPSNAKLIFWDYYHTSSDIYLQKLKQHRDLGCQDPWIASKFHILHVESTTAPL